MIRSSTHCFLALWLASLAPVMAQELKGYLPKAADGHVLNLDFETGDLRDWTAAGEAFKGQPIEGDSVARRRSDMKSGHQGKFWIGTYEIKQDAPEGTLTSAPFTLDAPFARFMIAGGAGEGTRFEIVRNDTKTVIYKTYGDISEELKGVTADLSNHVGKEVFLRLVDEDGGGWGHINFDDFRLWSTRPPDPVRPNAPSSDRYAHSGLSPEEAAKAMTLPPGFRSTLFAGEPDVVQPIAFTIDDRGRLWVAEAYSYPNKVAPGDAKDRVLIFEDTDGDGHFDTRKVFVDKLNLVSGIEVGFGGVWIGAAPELLYFHDKDGNDQPDGPGEVLLDGWGHQDTHETLNSFNWGPDGWLYGCHGVFTHSNVGKPGAPDSERTRLNAAIWRYHPTRHEFEVFLEGTSNPWGVDFDVNGQAFLTSCVIPHLYHVIQGGRYERQAGQHFNPYIYDDIKTIADHRHYVGGNPHAGNGRSDEMGGGHAHAGALIYNGDVWPKEFRGSILMNNIHGARLNRDLLEPSGSGFIGKHAPDFLLSNDVWSQIVSLKPGPDGQVYMIDWYDKNQCHRVEENIHDRTNGRIFQVAYGPKGQPSRAIDPSKATTLDLLKLLASDDEWHLRHARRILQERAAKFSKKERDYVIDRLRKVIASKLPDRIRLNAVWTLHAIDGIDVLQTVVQLKDQNPYIRAWTIQLVCERGVPTAATLKWFTKLAESDPSPVVRLYLASAAQRMPAPKRWPILEALNARSEDAQDQNIPYMVWFAAEPLADDDPERALKFGLDSKLPRILGNMVRRVAATGKTTAIASIVKTIGQAPTDPLKLTILVSLNESLKGRRAEAMPEGWKEVYEGLSKSADPNVKAQAESLAVTFGDPSALRGLREFLVDKSKDAGLRLQALASLLKARDPDLPATLRDLLAEPALRPGALRGLAEYDDPKSSTAILDVYPNLPPDERRDALNTLAARLESAKLLLKQVESGKIQARDLSADLVRQIRNHKNQELDDGLAKFWGNVRDTAADKLEAIARYKKMLTTKPKRVDAADLQLGRAVFAKTCQQCHVLFGTGGKIGPELTGSNRADLDYILTNVMDPSALIGKDYLAHVVATTDGRVLTGLIRSEDKDALTLQTANEIVTVPLKEVDSRKPSVESMMPADQWNPLSEREIRSLVAYLAGPGQVPLQATAENMAGFFNGRDLAGWVGNNELWSVESGEIVGKTPGLKRNEFLISEMSADDFHLTVDVKLVANEGNSGIQFRSESLPDGEIKGYQADVGVDWWGKLYEENGRGLLWPKSGEANVKPGEWNTYEIIAKGATIITKINGVECVNLVDELGARRGVFAFQLHAGGKTEVRFKNIKLELVK